MTTEIILEELFKEVRKNFHLLKKGAEVIHKRGDSTAGMRGIIEVLYDVGGDRIGQGSLTVAHVAKLKHVSRQSVQVLIDQMIELGWVQSHPNPFHKKSMLMGLTESGKKAFEKMKKEERSYMKELKLKIPQKKLEEVSQILNEINQSVVKFLAEK